MIEALKAPFTFASSKLRRLYNWVLSLANHKWGALCLFFLSLAESSFFPIPPDVLQIALSVAKPKRAFFYAAVSTVGSVLGGLLGWAIGLFFWQALGPYILAYVPGVTQSLIDHVGGIYQANAFWSICAAAFTPVPYKVFTISAGIFSEYISLHTFILASVIGRAGRFFLVATLLYFFGSRVQKLLEEKLEILTLGLFVAVALGFYVLKVFLH